jgi:hypothetical protein
MPDRWPATPETLTASLFEIASDELDAMGLVLKQAPGEYRVNSRWGPPATEYATDALQDAVQHDREMAAEPPPGPAPPLAVLPQLRWLRNCFEPVLRQPNPEDRRAVFCFHHAVAAAGFRSSEKPM